MNTEIIMNHHPLHEKAVSLTKQLKCVEAELVDVLQKIDFKKLFRQMGFSSLFEYVNRGLSLSESVSYALISVARKSAVVPELKMAIEQGELSISQAKRMTAVLTKDNAEELIEKAKNMTQRELEREVARINPQTLVKERTRYLTEDYVELRLSLKENTMKKLKRVQDLESQRTSNPCNLEQTLEAVIELYLERKDPVVRSKRILKYKSILKTQSVLKLQGNVKAKENLMPQSNLKSKKILHKPSSRKVNVKLQGTDLQSTVGGQKLMSGQTPEVQKEDRAQRVRTPIPATIKHQVYKRDQGQCTYHITDANEEENTDSIQTNSNQKSFHQNHTRCANRRWLEVHHKKPVNHGGDNSIENLATLCHAHHRMIHAIG